MRNFKAYFEVFLIAVLAIALIAPMSSAAQTQKVGFDNFKVPDDYNDGWYVLFESDAQNSYNKWHGLTLDKISDVENPEPTFIRYWYTFTNGVYKNNFYDYQQGNKTLTAFAGRPDIETVPADFKVTSIEDEIFPRRWKLLKKFCDGNIVACISGKLQHKFPFDVFANLPSSTITCPKITVTIGTESRDLDFCWMYEAMRPLKYAVAMSLVMKLFIHV